MTRPKDQTISNILFLSNVPKHYFKRGTFYYEQAKSFLASYFSYYQVAHIAIPFIQYPDILSCVKDAVDEVQQKGHSKEIQLEQDYHTIDFDTIQEILILHKYSSTLYEHFMTPVPMYGSWLLHHPRLANATPVAYLTYRERDALPEYNIFSIQRYSNYKEITPDGSPILLEQLQ